MAFSFLRTLLNLVTPRPDITVPEDAQEKLSEDWWQKLEDAGWKKPVELPPEQPLPSGLPEVTPEEERWLYSDEEFREKVEQSSREFPPQPKDPKEAFLYFGRWLFAAKSAHVAACRYDREAQTLFVSYSTTGDVWAYDPVSPILAEKFAEDLLGGSPGTDVWDHLRQRGTQRSHRPGLNARKL